MFLFYLPPRVLLIPLAPPWSILWRSQAARRILVHRVIVSLILAPRWARRLAIMVRRILVISPESSLHAHKVVLVFARARMYGHLPLVAPPNAHRESLRLLSHSSLIYWEICWAYVRWATFSSLVPFHRWADVTRFIMSFGLMEIWTPFNPKKTWWVNLWSMHPSHDTL
jgi:hypothetical protein